MCGVRCSDVGHGGDNISRHAEAPPVVVSRDVVGDRPEDGCQRRGAATPPGAGELRNRVDVAAQVAPSDGQARAGSLVRPSGGRLGRIRLRRISDGSADSLHTFVTETIEPGSFVHTDGWHGYDGLKAAGYRHRVTLLRGRQDLAMTCLPRVHRVASLLKRWRLGTHQGAVSQAHLDYYLDEFTFRFNRRTSRHRGLLFFRLAQQAVAVEPAPYHRLVKHVHRHRKR
jgi:transposase-like protein